MSIAAIAPVPARRKAMSRLITALALFVLCAVIFCTVAGSVLVRQADDRQEVDRRNALLGAITDLRASGANISALKPDVVRGLERIAGLKDLRFERDPVEDSNREMLSLLDKNGRIAGWFSWVPDRSMSRALGTLGPFLAVTAVLLIAFAIGALWQVRRAVRDLHKSERLAWKLAHEDMLTGLPNHRKMIDLIERALAERASGEVVALALVDLDGLNDVNDASGQEAGDQLLKALAARLRELLPRGAIGARYDGDEFALLLTAPDVASAEAAMRTITMSLGRPFWLNDQAVHVGATAGFALAPEHAQTRDEIFRRADLALRAAKRRERGGVLGFEPAMDRDFSDRRFIERELRRALLDNSLDVHYQAVVTSDGQRIVGAEALLRWTHPERGAIPPMTFIPVAEQSGLMGKLGEFVLRRAISDARRWPELSIAVNLSPVQVRDPQLVELVAQILSDLGFEPSRLVLEVTESVLIDQPQEAGARLAALRALGLRLALDDFGTGYSSLTYLQQFKFDTLKIDRAFVTPLGRSSDSQAMIQAIVALGRALGLTLLAEGVETEEQRVLLRLAGCEEMQGYLFARPGPREALDRLLEQNSPAARSAVA